VENSERPEVLDREREKNERRGGQMKCELSVAQLIGARRQDGAQAAACRKARRQLIVRRNDIRDLAWNRITWYLSSTSVLFQDTLRIAFRLTMGIPPAF